jgi:hypothetical protein
MVMNEPRACFQPLGTGEFKLISISIAFMHIYTVLRVKNSINIPISNFFLDIYLQKRYL